MTGAYNPGSKSRLSSPYDWRIDPLTGDKKEFHPGQDFSARAGTPVAAATSAWVIRFALRLSSAL
jgi:murein DD-endopeptidase MepM/ murein hydrolase activator NlpD